MFDGESSQEDDTVSNSTDSSESDDTDNEDDTEMSGGNQEGDPITGITTSVCTHPSSVITDDRIYEYIHRDYFVDSKNQEMNNAWRNNDIDK